MSNLDTYKKVMKDGMIKNFENDGYLTPVLFWVEKNQLFIAQIPPTYLKTFDGKNLLADMIRTKCTDVNTIAAGIIVEAYGAKISVDNPNAEKLKNNEIRVSELDEKQDIILMIFSTPESHEVITYNVDCENKNVLDEYINHDASNGVGIFSDFFKWNKN